MTRYDNHLTYLETVINKNGSCYSLLPSFFFTILGLSCSGWPSFSPSSNFYAVVHIHHSVAKDKYSICITATSMKDQPRKIVVWLPQNDRHGISNNQLLFSFWLKCLVTITPGYHIVATTNPSTGYYSVKTLRKELPQKVAHSRRRPCRLLLLLTTLCTAWTVVLCTAVM